MDHLSPASHVLQSSENSCLSADNTPKRCGYWFDWGLMMLLMCVRVLIKVWFCAFPGDQVFRSSAPISPISTSTNAEWLWSWVPVLPQSARLNRESERQHGVSFTAYINKGIKTDRNTSSSTYGVQPKQFLRICWEIRASIHVSTKLHVKLFRYESLVFKDFLTW